MLCMTLLYCGLGHAATIQITGLSKEREELAMEKLTPRLEFILKRDASSWRADDAAFFLRRIMIRSGYPDVNVEWKLPGSNIIGLDVNSGERYLFGTISSNHSEVMSSEELREYFLQPLVETELVSSKNAPYIEEYVERGVENVRNYLKSQGYWNASVKLNSKQRDRGEKWMNVSLTITSGQRLVIEKPFFSGVSEAHLNKIYPQIESLVGGVASTEHINKMRQLVENFYASNGYQFAKIQTKVVHLNKTTKISFNVNAGAQYKVNKVVVKGQEKTKRRKISRYFGDQKGENYDAAEINKVVAKLIATGAFKSVVVRPVQIAGVDEVNLEVEVEEADARSVKVYGGFGSYEGFIIGSTYSNRNYHGSLRNVYIGGEFSSRGLLGEVGIVEPRIFNSPIAFHARAYLVERNNEGYRTKKGGFESSFVWKPNSNYATRLFGNIEYASSSSTQLSDAELGPSDYGVSRFGLEQVVDLRDNRLLPTKGYHGRTLLETGLIAGDASNAFLRAETEHSYRFALNEQNSVVTRVRFAGIKPSDSSNLPIDIRLFSGGANTQRAFDERELGPQSISGESLGGEAYWLASAEYIRTISEPFKVIAFVDAGQLYSDIEDFGLSDASYAAGIGARIDIPIGAVRLEYGRNLNKKEGEPSGTFHFSIGTNF